MPLERLDELVSNVWLGYQEQNNQNYHGTALQFFVIVSMALICVARTMASITHCQQPISRSLYLPCWDLKSSSYHLPTIPLFALFNNSFIRSDEGLTLETSAFSFTVVIQPLSTRFIKPNFSFDLPHRRTTTVSLETRNPLTIWIYFQNESQSSSFAISVKFKEELL